MTDYCRAAVFNGDATYDVREFVVPDPPPGGAVLRVEAVGLCGSDVAQFHGVRLVPGASVFPVIPGHEIVGRVVKLANDSVLGVSEGGRVAVNEVLRSTSRLAVYGYSDMTGEGRLGLWGGYGEYMELLPGTMLFPMSDRLPADQLTFFEPLANAVNWVDAVGVVEGDVVVIQGPGHQGLAVLEAVMAKRPGMVIQTGTSADILRFAAARALGATHTIAVDHVDPLTFVNDLTGGRLADVVMDITSVPQAVALSVDLTRRGGRVLLAGLKHFAAVPNFVSDLIVVKGLTLVGGSGFTAASMQKAVDMLERGEAHGDVVLGEVLDLTRIGEAMALLERRAEGRDAVRVSLRHH